MDNDREILAQLSDAVISTDLKANITGWNKAAERTFGYSGNDVIGKSLTEVLPISYHAQTPDEVEDELREKGFWQGHVTYGGNNSDDITVDTTITVIKDSNSNPIEIVYLNRPITEQSVINQELSRLKANLEIERNQLLITLQSTGDAVITTDENGNVTLINRIAEILTGWPSQEAAGKHIDEIMTLINEVTGENITNPIVEVVNKRKTVSLANHAVLIARDGTRRLIADSGAPIVDASGRFYGVIMVFRDVTAFRKMEAEMIKASGLESLGILAGGIAHDFNNLLAGIMGNISIVQSGKMGNKDAQARLHDAELASIRAKDLVQQLLTFSKGGKPQMTVVELGGIIREASHFNLMGSNIRCSLDIADDLWPVEVDPGQISQVLSNLIINAKEAMPSGGHLSVSAHNIHRGTPGKNKPKHFVEILLQDTGKGITEGTIGKIFDPYFTTKTGGSGLGLATSYSIIKNHGGNIIVKSIPDEGTSFRFYLPAIKDTKKMETKKLEVSIKGTGRILIMDDEESIRSLLENMLSTLGYHAISVSDGADALQLYREALHLACPYDAVILDLTVPGGMGGKEAMEGLLEIDPNVKAIVSSGYSNDTTVSEYKSCGFKAALSKPYSMQELSTVIAQVISTAK